MVNHEQIKSLTEVYPTGQVASEKILDDGRLAGVIVRMYNSIIIADVSLFGFAEQW